MIAAPSVIPSAQAVRKRDALEAWLRESGSVLVGFSGGVDSAYLSVIAREVLGSAQVLAVLGVSASLAGDLHERARVIARQFHVPFREIGTHELDDPDYIANRGDRCFFCKQELWNRLVPAARAAGLGCVVDGTIVDDLSEHRPGMRAGRAAGVRSPLAECGFTKQDVRELAHARGIPLWDAPAAPCLASRIAVGTEVNSDRLAAVERAEVSLRALGIGGDLRVRHLGDAARVELSPAMAAEWRGTEGQRAIAAAVQDAGFRRVLFAVHGYQRGALAEGLPVEVTDITVAASTDGDDTSP